MDNNIEYFFYISKCLKKKDNGEDRKDFILKLFNIDNISKIENNLGENFSHMEFWYLSNFDTSLFEGDTRFIMTELLHFLQSLNMVASVNIQLPHIGFSLHFRNHIEEDKYVQEVKLLHNFNTVNSKATSTSIEFRSETTIDN